MDDAKLIEAMARGFYEAVDPHTGDTIATTIHSAEHGSWVYAEGTLAEQLASVAETCRTGATAALAAIREAGYEVVRKPTVGERIIEGMKEARAHARGELG